MSSPAMSHKSKPAKRPASLSYSFPKLFCLAITFPGLQQCAGKICRMIPGRKPKWAQLLQTQEATREAKVLVWQPCNFQTWWRWL